MKKLVKIIAISLFSSMAVADTQWLNIASTHVSVSEVIFETTAYPTFSQEACEKSQVEYARLSSVHYVSCDIEPLPANSIAQTVK